MIFGDYFFKRKIQGLIDAQRTRKHQYCSLDEAKDILILYRLEDAQALEPQLKKLRSMNKRVRCCVCCGHDASQPADPSVVYINKAARTDRNGMPDAELSAEISALPADILIDLSRGKCHTLKALMLQHPSRFKAGERLQDESVYDFSVIMTDGGGIGELFEYLLFYLRTIRTK